MPRAPADLAQVPSAAAGKGKQHSLCRKLLLKETRQPQAWLSTAGLGGFKQPWGAGARGCISSQSSPP